MRSTTLRPRRGRGPNTPATSTPATSTPATTAIAAQPRYELRELIQAGATTRVWRGRDTITDDEVVVKLLDSAAANDEVALRRLGEEASMLTRLAHPNALPLVDRVVHDGQPGLVFPFIHGRTLADRLQDGPLAPDEAAGVTRALADVLAMAHEAGIVHRDVKPANVLLADDGSVRLIDFGIARAIADDRDGDVIDETRLDMTGVGMAVGTLHYMAPEQLSGGAPSPQGDVYALGVVLYEMLAGHRPYAGASPAEQLALQTRQPEPITAPAALADLAGEMLDPVPINRPTAHEVVGSLRAWIETGVDSEGETAAYVMTAPPPHARRRFAIAGMSAAFMALAIAGVFAASQLMPAAAPSDSQPSADAVVAADGEASVAPATSSPEPSLPAVKPAVNRPTSNPPAAQPPPPAADDKPTAEKPKADKPKADKKHHKKPHKPKHHKPKKKHRKH
jgi:serine/threonine protein kinase